MPPEVTGLRDEDDLDDELLDNEPKEEVEE